jgi:hypothetical protein
LLYKGLLVKQYPVAFTLNALHLAENLTLHGSKVNLMKLVIERAKNTV